jgi:hypothetical protein
VKSKRILSFYARRLVIIESVPAGQLEPGWSLFSRMKEWDDLQMQLLPEYYKVNTLFELITELRMLTESVPEKGVPILHLSMHGGDDGLQLASGEFITWAQLSPHVVNLNISTNNNLFISVAACFGFYSASVNSQKWDRSASGASSDEGIPIQLATLRMTTLDFTEHGLNHQTLDMLLKPSTMEIKWNI